MKPETFGNYTLIRPLGKGGMAEVFLAQARSIGGFEKLVAIKRLLPPFNIDNQILSMLADEARLHVWLTHPSIVQVLDFGKVGKTYYIAMEYVEGCDLCDLVRPEGRTPGRPLPLPTALYVMVQVAEALDFAHRRRNDKGEHLGVIHRDVSPHNVLISTEGQVKLADFGLARASISVHHSHEGVIRGKFSYMPKEQAHGRKIDNRIDLFATGVSLYEALTGSKPYTATTLAQQLYQLEQPIPPPSALIADIPEEIDDLTMQAMSPDPEDRYQNAEDLADDLRNALLKVSTFAQEEKQLTALVKNALATRGIQPVQGAIPHMSLADLPVTDDNLLGSELRAIQETVRPEDVSFRAASRDSYQPGDFAARGSFSAARGPAGPPLTDEIPDIMDEDEEGETAQFVQNDPIASIQAPPPEDNFDSQRTMALPQPREASSLPPAALDPGAGGPADPVEDAEAIDHPPGVVAGELDSSRPAGGAPPSAEQSFPSPAELGLMDAPEYPESVPEVAIQPRPSYPEHQTSAPLTPDSIDIPDQAPYDTLRDPEEAGRLAQEALDYARTIQRSPEEALDAFQRALDEREQLRRAAMRSRLRAIHWVGLVAVGVLLLCGGIALGWYLTTTGTLGSSVGLDKPKDCPKPAPCPVCPKQPSAVPMPSTTKPDAGAKPDAALPDGSPKHEDAGATGDKPAGDDAAKEPRPKRPRRKRSRRTHRRRPPDRVPAGKGVLVITADSPATAYVGTRNVGPVPLKVPVPPGFHYVKVRFLEIDSFSQVRPVMVTAGKTTQLNFILEE